MDVLSLFVIKVYDLIINNKIIQILTSLNNQKLTRLMSTYFSDIDKDSPSFESASFSEDFLIINCNDDS